MSDDVLDVVKTMWEMGEASPEEILSRQAARIQQLRDELSRVTVERDNQYDENVRRIAAQGRAELETAKWQWVVRQYEKFCYTHSWMPSAADILAEYNEQDLPPMDVFSEDEVEPTDLSGYYKAQAEENEYQLTEAIKRESTLRQELDDALTAVSVLRGAVLLTREYVGEEVLPEIVGWACLAYADSLLRGRG